MSSHVPFNDQNHQNSLKSTRSLNRMVRDETQVYGRGIVGLTLEAWLDACRGLSLPFSRYEAPKFRGSRPG